MASIVEAKNPLTGAVEKVDKLDHTAKEIDDAVERAFSAAQRGYGDAMEVFSGTEAELENAFSSIIAALPRFSSKQITFTCGDGTLYGKGSFSAVIYKNEDSYANLTASVYFNNYSVRKSYFGGVWYPFEWVNPPMELGVEYRTTERYLGNPVYTMAVDFGSLPNNTIKLVTFGDSTVKMIGAKGVMRGGYVIPGCTGDSSFPAAEMQIFTQDGGEDGAYVGVLTHTDRSSYTAVIVAKYWKTTD